MVARAVYHSDRPFPLKSSINAVRAGGNPSSTNKSDSSTNRSRCRYSRAIQRPMRGNLVGWIWCNARTQLRGCTLETLHRLREPLRACRFSQAITSPMRRTVEASPKHHRRRRIHAPRRPPPRPIHALPGITPPLAPQASSILARRRLWSAVRITALPACGASLQALSQQAPLPTRPPSPFSLPISHLLTSHFSLLTTRFRRCSTPLEKSASTVNVLAGSGTTLGPS